MQLMSLGFSFFLGGILGLVVLDNFNKTGPMKVFEHVKRLLCSQHVETVPYVSLREGNFMVHCTSAWLCHMVSFPVLRTDLAVVWLLSCVNMMVHHLGGQANCMQLIETTGWLA